jgi:hypothetical protein
MSKEAKEIRLRLMKSSYESDLAEYREKGYIRGIGSRYWNCPEYFEEFLERKRAEIERLETELKEENA